jgi:hypothetical protein
MFKSQYQSNNAGTKDYHSNFFPALCVSANKVYIVNTVLCKLSRPEGLQILLLTLFYTQVLVKFTNKCISSGARYVILHLLCGKCFCSGLHMSLVCKDSKLWPVSGCIIMSLVFIWTGRANNKQTNKLVIQDLVANTVGEVLPTPPTAPYNFFPKTKSS